MKQYGWYSATSHLKYGTGACIYSTPSSNDTVLVSLVSNSPNEHKSNWKDIVCVGEVVDFIKRIPGSWDGSAPPDFLEIELENEQNENC